MKDVDILPTAKAGDSGINNRCCQRQSDAVSTTGRCPFPVNIRGRVLVTVMGRITAIARPHAVSEGDMGIESATDAAQFCGRKPGIDMRHDRPCFRRNMMQDINKRGEAQIRDLATPERLHAAQVQRLQTDMVILLTQLVGEIPVEALPEMRGPTMHTGQMPLSLVAIVGTPFTLRESWRLAWAMCRSPCLNGCGARISVPSLPTR